MSPDNTTAYKMDFSEVKLSMKYLEIDPKIEHAIQRKLCTPAVYNIYDATDIQARHILPRSRSYAFENVFFWRPDSQSSYLCNGIPRGLRGVLKEKPLKFPAL